MRRARVSGRKAACDGDKEREGGEGDSERVSVWCCVQCGAAGKG